MHAAAEFLLVVPTVSLAHIAFSQALGMVDKGRDGFLRKRLHVQEHLRRIIEAERPDAGDLGLQRLPAIGRHRRSAGDPIDPLPIGNLSPRTLWLIEVVARPASIT